MKKAVTEEEKWMTNRDKKLRPNLAETWQMPPSLHAIASAPTNANDFQRLYKGMDKGFAFRSWLITEETWRKSKGLHVFFDMNETLVATMEVGWLKDDPANANYAPLLQSGSEPFPDVVSIQLEGQKVHVFPRPGLREFLEEVKKFAAIHILSHGKIDEVKKVVKALKLTDLLPIAELHSTRDLAPGDLERKYELDNTNWILVDNLWPTTAEVINKMRILGLNFPGKKPNEEGELVATIGKARFVNVKEYRAEVAEQQDFELFRALGEIKRKLGLPLENK